MCKAKWTKFKDTLQITHLVRLITTITRSRILLDKYSRTSIWCQITRKQTKVSATLVRVKARSLLFQHQRHLILEVRQVKEEERIGRGDRLEVRREKSGRGGKAVTTVAGFPAGINMPMRASLRKRMKTKLGTGGTWDGDCMELQGDKRQEVVSWLSALGFKPILAGGWPADQVSLQFAFPLLGGWIPRLASRNPCCRNPSSRNPWNHDLRSVLGSWRR